MKKVRAIFHCEGWDGWPTHSKCNSKSHIKGGCPILPRSVRKGGRRERCSQNGRNHIGFDVGSSTSASQAHPADHQFHSAGWPRFVSVLWTLTWEGNPPLRSWHIPSSFRQFVIEDCPGLARSFCRFAPNPPLKSPSFFYSAGVCAPTRSRSHASRYFSKSPPSRFFVPSG